MDKHLSNHLEHYKMLIDKVFNTPDGEELLILLKNDYCDLSVLSSNVEKTFYNLGKKELVEELIRAKENPNYVEDCLNCLDIAR